MVLHFSLPPLMQPSDRTGEASRLINDVKTSDLHVIYDRFSEYLSPFNELILKLSKGIALDKDIILPLKPFSDFLKAAVECIDLRFRDLEIESEALKLLQCWKLSLNCLNVLGVLDIKQWVSLLLTLEGAKQHKDARDQGLLFIKALEPICEVGKVDALEKAVVIVFRYFFAGGTNTEEDYRDLLFMVGILRTLCLGPDSELNKVLRKHGIKCILFLVREGSLDQSQITQITEFYHYILKAYDYRPKYHKLKNFVLETCKTIWSHSAHPSKDTMRILHDVLLATTSILKKYIHKMNDVFLKLFDEYAICCRNAPVQLHDEVAITFYKLGEEFRMHQNSKFYLVMMLYSKTFAMQKAQQALPDKRASKIRVYFEKVGRVLEDIKTCDPINTPVLRFSFGTLAQLINSNTEVLYTILETQPGISHAIIQCSSVFLNSSECDLAKYGHGYSTKVAVTVAALLAKLATTENVELMLSEAVTQESLWNDAFELLRDLGITLYKANKKKQAAVAIQYSCELAWKLVSDTCLDIGGENKEGSLSAALLEKNVTIASKHSAFLLKLLHEIGNDYEKMREKLKSYLKQWAEAKMKFDIHVPSALTKQWVQITCQELTHIGSGYYEHSLTSLYPSTLSNETVDILLEQELVAYETTDKPSDTNVCDEMKGAIELRLLQNVYNNNDKMWSMQRPKSLITKARHARARGVDSLNECLTYLSSAIVMMTNQGEDGRGHFRYLLPEAYCLRALCIQEAESNLQLAIKDVEEALKVWSSEACFRVDEDIEAGHILTLLINAVSLLTLKGYTGLHEKIYKKLLECLKWKGEPWHRCLTLLWGSTSHALCTSPLSREFITAISTTESQSQAEQDSVKFWTSYMEGTALKVGFRQSLSVTCANPGSHNHNNAIDSVKRVAADLIINGTKGSSNSQLFIASRLYYDLAELLIAEGSAIEALMYANQALEMRQELFENRFWCETAPDPYIDAKERPSKKFLYNVRPVIATQCWRGNGSEVNLLECMVTPWSALQAYLESTLQTGSFWEIFGEEEKATKALELVLEMATTEVLPQFEVRSNLALAKLNFGKKLVAIARNQTREAYKTWRDRDKELFSCSKCSVLLKATVLQQLGDMRHGGHTTSSEKPAESLYEKAQRLLEDHQWRNNVSMGEGSELCGGKGSSVGEGSCWHSLQESISNSDSLGDKVNMKWECQRRRLLLKVFSGIGYNWRSKSQFEREHEALLKCIWVLANRSTFDPKTCIISTSYLYDNLIKRNVISQMFALEYATILYQTCQISLLRHGKHDQFLSVEELVNGLKLSFILCREASTLCKKVSKLLSVIFATAIEKYPQSYSSLFGKKLSQSKWTSFFHQNSLGNWFDNVMSLHMKRKQGDNQAVVSTLLSSTSLRSILDFEDHIQKFFDDLPPVRILCMSIFEKDFEGMLPKNYIMLSRLGLEDAPTVILMPIGDVPPAAGSPPYKRREVENWSCPWEQTIIDLVAQPYRDILRDNYYGQKGPVTNSELQLFLKNVEKNWFGSWKHMLLGECSRSDSEPLNKILKDGGCCYVSGKGMQGDAQRIFKKLVLMENKDLEIEREPLIYVLDMEIEMLPWENLPVLIDGRQEVYRMPSVRSISHTLDRNRGTTSHTLGKKDHGLPTIDPFNAYYMCNATGDLRQTDKRFWEWFKKNNMEGRAGTPPPANVLKDALQKHHLFIYFGHGDGLNFVGSDNIEDVEGSSAALLIGCSSASLRLSGQYNPACAVFHYLKAGSPFVVGCLWPVLAVDSDNFSVHMLNEWLKSNGKGIAWHVREAKEACQLRYLTAGSLVTYGVPTLLKTERQFFLLT